MLRSMMQVYVKGSREALQCYQQAFQGEILCTYPGENGGYYHAELNAHGQILAVSELTEECRPGNTMQFCFHMGPGQEAAVETAYQALKPGATLLVPLGPCDYSPSMFSLIDRFGVCWCVFV